MKQALPQVSVQTFKKRLTEYKKSIDNDISGYSRDLISLTKEHFGDNSAESMRIFCDVLNRGGKRIRGALTMLAYEMYGGKDPEVALRAARAMEVIQTYLLVVDDVYDRSRTRRGLPSAHVLLEELHEGNHWKDDAHHFGESMAFNTGLVGSHIAMEIVAGLAVEPQYLVRAFKLLNTNLHITGEGQANDIYNEVTETAERSKVENVLLWKTAYYTFVNPLQFGATLAGASEDELNKLREYSLAAGRTFQISDDILGVFGSEFESGKSPMDDIREGKRTILSVHTLEHAAKEDAYFLERMLGNHDLTSAEFKRCQDIIYNAGSLEFAKAEAGESARHAMQLADTYWLDDKPEYALFLKGLVEYLMDRKS